MIRKMTISLLTIITILLSGCAVVENLAKEIESDTKGLDREVVVYNTVGDVIFEGEGVIRVEPTKYGNKVIFQLGGKRYAFYNATVMMIEK